MVLDGYDACPSGEMRKSLLLFVSKEDTIIKYFVLLIWTVEDDSMTSFGVPEQPQSPDCDRR